MNKFLLCVLTFILPFSCTSGGGNMKTKHNKGGSDTVQQNNIPEGFVRLRQAYKAFIADYDNNKVLFTDGTSMAYDDKKKKSYTTSLDYADIEDMFSIRYRIKHTIPSYCEDAGRIRCDELFKKMYGKTEKEVAANLVTINWFGRNIKFSQINGAADSLKKIRNELSRHPEYAKYLQSSTSYYWRKVRGANRMSAHSYGIAIDINTQYSNFWKWTNPHKTEIDKIGYENQIPIGIVKIFEKYGFIWGGAWYHYDTMHFEFRPELL